MLIRIHYSENPLGDDAERAARAREHTHKVRGDRIIWTKVAKGMEVSGFDGSCTSDCAYTLSVHSVAYKMLHLHCIHFAL